MQDQIDNIVRLFSVNAREIRPGESYYMVTNASYTIFVDEQGLPVKREIITVFNNDLFHLRINQYLDGTVTGRPSSLKTPSNMALFIAKPEEVEALQDFLGDDFYVLPVETSDINEFASAFVTNRMIDLGLVAPEAAIAA